MSDLPQQPAGWYYADGDPPGTKRFWNGSSWEGEPQPMMSAAMEPGVQATGPGGLTVSNEWKRIGARVIDVIILGVVSVFFAAIGGGFDNLTDPDQAFEFSTWTVLAAVAAFVWDGLFVAFAGGTPGKLILGMRVVAADSGATPPGPQPGFLRALNRLLPLIPGLGSLIGIVIGIVSLVFLFTDDQKRTVMDRVGKTMVVDV